MAATLAPTFNQRGSIERVDLAWTSAADGTGALAIADLVGPLIQVEFSPGTGGVQPTNGYSLTLTDSAGVDILAGQGAALSNTTGSRKSPGVTITDGTNNGPMIPVLFGAHTLNISGAGNAKQGILTLFLRK
jgi:hypothetical protein